MCDDGQIELDWNSKCDLCGHKPACDLRNHLTGEADLGYKSLCEACGVKLFSEDVVSDWAGTDLYLKRNPAEIEIWRDK